MQNEKVESIKLELEKDKIEVEDLKQLNDLKVKYLGKNGLITDINSEIRNIDASLKKEFGMMVNSLRTDFNSFY